MKPSLILALAAACLLGACAAPQTSALGPGVAEPQIRMHMVCDRTTGRVVALVVSTTGRGTWAQPVEAGDLECPPVAGGT